MTLSRYARSRALALPPVIRGMLWMALCSLCFAALNASTRTITADLHPWQTQCLRYAFGALVLLPLALKQGAGIFRTRNLRLHLARNLLHTSGTCLWFLALPHVPLAEVTAIGFTSPIFLTIGALLFFGEIVRLRRWLAIFFGFLGVLIVLYPNLRLGISASWASLLVLCSAPIASTSYLIAKVLMRYDPPQTVVFWQGVLVSAFTLPLAIWFWGPMTPQHIALFVLIGALGSMGHYALNRSLRAADISASQPARFLELIWASALGFMIWGDVPPVWTFIGAVVIFGSTTYIAHREARIARQADSGNFPSAAKSP